MRKLKIALIGCGQIADAHLQEIRKIPLAELVAVCDRERDLAEQAAARFEVPRTYDDLNRMLADVRPDVLHVTTPPQTHRSIALRAFASGVHVYMEKPFTCDVAEADVVLGGARSNGCLVCVGHDQLFDPVWRRCQQIIRTGRIGRVVHVDSLQGYDLNSPFGRALTSEPDHWVHRLPGGLFQNVISHALYRITDCLPDANPEVRASAFSATARSASQTELRVMLRGADVTANLMFSSFVRPVQRMARIYGTSGSLEVDLDGRTIRLSSPLTAPGPFAKIQAPARHLVQAAGELGQSLLQLARGGIQYFEGMNQLFTLFYRSIVQGTEAPIPAHEIRRVTAIMDRIFSPERPPKCRGRSCSIASRATGSVGNTGLVALGSGAR
jgi:predicted dehydrogenase